MYLSCLLLQVSAPSVRQALRNCQDMHRNLMKAFDCTRDEAAVLYRIVRTDTSIRAYVQSEALPRWERVEALGYRCEQTRDISGLPKIFQKDMRLRFSLLAVPSKKIKSGEKNSRRILLRGEAERGSWLARQGEKNGFSLIEAHEAAKEQLLFGTRSSGDFYLSGVPFEGALRITDAEAFRNGFRRGIGPEKAYGFGMLMLRRST